MPQVQVVNMAGEKVSDIELNDAVFGIKPNKAAMHLAVVQYLANRRRGTQSTLTRAEVSGGGKKPWRQKGTGRARQGSTRAPQWYHGGIAFGPKPRDYGFSLNRKVKKLAMLSALSSKVLDDDFIVLDELSLEQIKTKKMAEILKNVGVEKKALIIAAAKDENIIKSARNLPGVKTALTNTINVYDILNAGKVVIVKDAVSMLEEVYA